MKVTVRYFAAFREASRSQNESVDTGAPSTGALFEECRQRHPGLVAWDASLVAINDEMVQWDSPFSDGDEVLFFPPVAGG